MDIRYRIQGGYSLQGDVTVSGSKNAALPLIAGCVLTSGKTVYRNVPYLRDVKALLKILNYLGAETEFSDSTVTVDTTNLQSKPIPAEFVGKLRGSIVLLGPLLARFGVVEMSYPGGCVLGKRPVAAHISALSQLGAEDSSSDDTLHLQGRPRPSRVILPEFSVTATENAIFAAALTEGETRIDLAACEPHVIAVSKFIQQMGAEVDGIGSHTLFIRGKKTLEPTEFTVPPDYLEAGALSLAAVVTGGNVNLHNTDYEDLLFFLDTLKRMGVAWKFDESAKVLTVNGDASSLKAIEVRTNIAPGFPTDLMAPLGVALTQANGVSRIFERLYEGRMAYLYELEKMGAHIEILNSHQALIIGPTSLRGRTVASNDIRAGAAMVLAALCAEGETLITDVRYVERGYDHLDDKLRSLGAHIEKIETLTPEEIAEQVSKKKIEENVKGREESKEHQVVSD